MKTINAREVTAGTAVSLESLLRVPMIAENEDDIREAANHLLMEGDRYVIVDACDVSEDGYANVTINALDSEHSMSIGALVELDIAS